MTRKSLIALPLSIVGAMLLAGPVAAGEMIVEGRSVYQERVSFADLDLRKSRDRQTLKGRVHRASDRVCIAAEGSLWQYSPAWGRDAGMTCSDLTYDAAHPQISAAFDRARSGQSMAMALVITAPARSR